MKYSLILLLLALSLSSCAQTAADSTAQLMASVEQHRHDDPQLMNEIGQMLVIGFRGTELSDTNHIVRDIKELNIGGVILFEYDAPSGSRPRNITSPEQLTQLCRSLQELSDNTLLISIDQEGGKVNRLKESYGFPRFASAQQTARYGIDSVRYYAQLTGKTLKSLGINLNFAPCVDVNINPNCPVIGKIERSFSAHPKQVARYASCWIESQGRYGVISCLKHFPGHGSSLKDTHAGLADVTNTWEHKELDPYKKLIASGKVDMIMTTHVFNANLDSLYPATLSRLTLTNLLRDSLHYNGIIITDDLAMGAMVKEYTYEEILQRAINAGADMLCLSNNGKEYNANIVPQTLEIIYQLVQEGKIERNRIREAASRVASLKQKYSHYEEIYH